MRYNDDVINAENWNTGLKKSGLSINPDSDEISEHQNNTVLKTIVPAAVNLSADTDDKTANKNKIEINPSHLNIRASRKRISRRKKGGMFILSGLLAGLVSRSRHRK
jgi:hypothetical protein